VAGDGKGRRKAPIQKDGQQGKTTREEKETHDASVGGREGYALKGRENRRGALSTKRGGQTTGRAPEGEGTFLEKIATARELRSPSLRSTPSGMGGVRENNTEREGGHFKFQSLTARKTEVGQPQRRKKKKQDFVGREKRDAGLEKKKGTKGNGKRGDGAKRRNGPGTYDLQKKGKGERRGRNRWNGKCTDNEV